MLVSQDVCPFWATVERWQSNLVALSILHFNLKYLKTQNIVLHLKRSFEMSVLLFMCVGCDIACVVHICVSK